MCFLKLNKINLYSLSAFHNTKASFLVLFFNAKLFLSFILFLGEQRQIKFASRSLKIQLHQINSVDSSLLSQYNHLEK